MAGEEKVREIVERLYPRFKDRNINARHPAWLLQPLQIHFAGTQRTGKTTLAKIVMEIMEDLGFDPILVDIDETRTKIFSEDEPKIGSPLQQWMQTRAYEAVFNLRLPDILKSGGVPITTATHSRLELYQKAKRVSLENNSALRFIILEAPSIEEVAKRCQTSGPDDRSDMTDLLNNPRQRKVYEDTVARFNAAYSGFSEFHFKIPQGPLAEMAEKALCFILDIKYN